MKRRSAFFATNKFGLLAGLAYPDLDKERFRTSCDLMNIFFVLDDLTDVATASEVREMSNAVVDALRNADKPRAHDEWVGGEIARQFWILARNYFALRRVTVGLKPSLMIFEFGMELPREVLQHPTIEKLSLLCTDLILIDNDMASYNKEQACGDDKHNIVAIAMDQLHLDVQGAMNWAADYHAATVRQFREVYETIPRWGGQVDLDIETYVDGMGNWVRANVQWSFESERYFGNKSGRVMTTRRMSLLPRTRPEDVGLSEICAVKG
ncbi:delta(6)-protoilludene synthase [Hirsutella rhossiliensis]|uniref:Terpene synthase n=1 Tax=Hirsutella rhossiliensis TaxID=111463 RepID=A0A9P8MW31_9HYPO|nr:delta(6)-protoilludene synthase [Hirsutella rhossiliensis]KAH0961301.1 delta(6)-protoilludene synthase [Hirsutella rhossiliensis]